MTMVYFAGLQLDHDNADPPVAIRGYDMAGNLLVKIHAGSRIAGAVMALEEEYAGPRWRFPAYDLNGRPVLAQTSSEEPPFEWSPGCVAVSRAGRIFSPSAITSKVFGRDVSYDGGETWIGGKLYILDVIRVFRRGGDRVPFPQLHGAAICAICLDDDGNIYVGGYIHYSDNVNLRKYDADGTLLWSALVEAEYLGDARGNQIILDIHISSDGYLYVSSVQDGTQFYGGSGATAKYSTAGVEQWTQYCPGGAVWNVFTDGAGSVFSIGTASDGAGFYTPFQKRDSSTGAVVSVPASTADLAAAGAYHDGEIHIIKTTASSSMAWDYRRYDAADLSVIAEYDLGHSVYADNFSIRENFAIDSDGMAYFGSRTGTEWRQHFLAATPGGGGKWETLAASGAVGVNREGGEQISDTYLALAYVTPYGDDAGPDHGYLQFGVGYVDFWSPAFVFIVDGTETPPAAIPVRLGAFSWIGDTYTNASGLALPVYLRLPDFRREYAGTLRLPDVYGLTLTGSPDLALPLSMIQCRRSISGLSLTVTCPAATSSMIAEIQARSAGALIVSRGVRFSDGSIQIEEMLRATAWSMRYDLGAQSGSITLSGSSESAPATLRARALNGISYRNTTGGKRRVRCSIDTFASPGDTAILGAGESMTIGEITYSIGPGRGEMEILEA